MIEPTRLIPLRHLFLRAIREWFFAEGFIEVDTPICVPSPGMEPHLRAFEVTTQEAPPLYRRAFLHTSPEYHMKRLLASHPAPTFQLCHCFRDEPASRLHAPEFTMLEWYRPEADYRRLMVDCEQLLESVATALLGAPELRLPEGAIDLRAPYPRLTVREAMTTHAGIDPFAESTADDLARAARRAGLQVGDDWPWDDIFHFALLERVEAHLGTDRPTVLTDYPPRLAALARVRGGVAERFELYIAGQELANAFSELTDSREQRRRFEQERGLRVQLGRPAYPIDEALIEALDQLPPCAGIALGADRLFLLCAEHVLGRRLGLSDVIF